MTQNPRITEGIPHISEDDPLPKIEAPEGRWGAPYLSQRSGLWTAFTRRPLTSRQVDKGLASFVSAPSREELARRMEEEDERARQVDEESSSVPAWSHRV